MKVALEYDDFSPTNSNFGILEKFKEHYPDFKVTMFTVPWEIRFQPQDMGSPITREKYKPWVDAVNDCDWIEIALHGLTHAPREFEKMDYDTAIKTITVGMKMFENVGFKNFVKIFKAPQWLLSPDGKRAAEDMGFLVVEDKYYNWNLENPTPDQGAAEPFIMHGHIQDDCGNGMMETMHTVLKLPVDTEFLFLSDIYNLEKGKYEYFK